VDVVFKHAYLGVVRSLSRGGGAGAAFARAGVALTIGLLILAAVATVHTIRLLIFVFENSHTRTFEDSIEGLAGACLRLDAEECLVACLFKGDNITMAVESQALRANYYCL
jgi:hypothetical protein